MATLQVRIENGFFVGTNGCYVSTVEPTHVIANGWECLIDEDGTIKCDAVRGYSDGEWIGYNNLDKKDKDML